MRGVAKKMDDAKRYYEPNYESWLQQNLRKLSRRIQIAHYNLTISAYSTQDYMQFGSTTFQDFIQYLDDYFPREIQKQLYGEVFPLHLLLEELTGHLESLHSQLKELSISNAQFEKALVKLYTQFLRILERKETKLEVK